MKPTYSYPSEDEDRIYRDMIARDCIARMCLQNFSADELAKRAYDLGDAMIKERAKRTKR